MSLVSYLNKNQIVSSNATTLPLSTGNKKNRLLLNGVHDNKTRINVWVFWVNLLELVDRLGHKLGYERKWVKIKIQTTNNKIEYVLLNINSLCKRTLLKRKEVLSKTVDELSSTLANPVNVVFYCKKLKELFPHVLLINLDHKKDRLAKLHEHLKKVGQSDFVYERISGVSGKELPLREISRMSRSDNAKRHGTDDRTGRLGCLLSHLSAIKLAKARGLPSVLICEDDVRFMPHNLAKNDIQKALNELPEEWGILFLGYYEVEKDRIESYSDHLIKPACPYDMHAYFVNASMYDEFIEKFESELKKDNGCMRACDVVIAEDMTKTGRIYALKENVAIQDEGVSSILNCYVSGNYIREVRRLKEDISLLETIQSKPMSVVLKDPEIANISHLIFQ